MLPGSLCVIALLLATANGQDNSRDEFDRCMVGVVNGKLTKRVVIDRLNVQLIREWMQPCHDPCETGDSDCERDILWAECDLIADTFSKEGDKQPCKDEAAGDIKPTSETTTTTTTMSNARTKSTTTTTATTTTSHAHRVPEPRCGTTICYNGNTCSPSAECVCGDGDACKSGEICDATGENMKCIAAEKMCYSGVYLDDGRQIYNNCYTKGSHHGQLVDWIYAEYRIPSQDSKGNPADTPKILDSEFHLGGKYNQIWADSFDIPKSRLERTGQEFVLEEIPSGDVSNGSHTATALWNLEDSDEQLHCWGENEDERYWKPDCYKGFHMRNNEAQTYIGTFKFDEKWEEVERQRSVGKTAVYTNVENIRAPAAVRDHRYEKDIRGDDGEEMLNGMGFVRAFCGEGRGDQCRTRNIWEIEGNDIISASLTSNKKFDARAEGVWAMRVKVFGDDINDYNKGEMPKMIGTGSWPAWWTTGAHTYQIWPKDGELDIMEFWTGKNGDGGSRKSSEHFPNGPVNGQNAYWGPKWDDMNMWNCTTRKTNWYDNSRDKEGFSVFVMERKYEKVEKVSGRDILRLKLRMYILDSWDTYERMDNSSNFRSEVEKHQADQVTDKVGGFVVVPDDICRCIGEGKDTAVSWTEDYCLDQYDIAMGLLDPETEENVVDGYEWQMRLNTAIGSNNGGDGPFKDMADYTEFVMPEDGISTILVV